MDIIIGIVIGLALAWTASTGDRWRRLKDAVRDLTRSEPAAEAPAAIAADAPSEAATSEPATADLTRRLAELQREFESVLEQEPHSRNFYANRQFNAAVALLVDSSVPLDIAVAHAIGTSWAMSCVGLAALKQRVDREAARTQVLNNFDRLVPFAFYFAFEYFQSLSEQPPVGAPILRARDWWQNNTLITILLREHLAAAEARGQPIAFGAELARYPTFDHDAVVGILNRVEHPGAALLRAELDAHKRKTIDEAFLTTFGRFWRKEQRTEVVVEPGSWMEALTLTEETARVAPYRSLLVAGDHRVGKTSYLRALARRLEQDGWVVFEAGGADLMAGQKWFGELEGRIQRTLAEVNVDKKLIWYIPDLLQVALSGSHQGQAASILDQILPAVSAGTLIVWTECSASGISRLLRLSPALRSAFEVVRLEPMTQAETATLAHAVSGELAGALTIDTACIDGAIAAARQYLSTSSLPGSVLDLLKLTIGRMAKTDETHVDQDDIIATLSQLTGLPASILDNKERLDLAAMRAHFAARVIGQDEAVGAVVERIAMLKAGLNDLSKPIGVLMFAGSTGTGKTELAKTLAEFLFGGIERMIRLDMSEYQTPESTAKILGGVSDRSTAEVDSLITRVRKQPFSVVLLDEFEKAHPNVWDLFLQVFDDGRLTDSVGQIADFRHCIIILTTNLGATAHRNSGLGFAPGSDDFSPEQILRAVGQTFRPEFQNRIDKIIVFRPLTRALMRGILQKELAQLLERRGLKDREWAVEWEASALEFLLEKGFSPEMGARPLKRAIDQYVLAPLAATIVERRFPEGDQFVFIRSDGRGIVTEFVDPDHDPERSNGRAVPAKGETPSLPAMILSPGGTELEEATLEAALAEVSAAVAAPAWEERQADLAARMSEPDFWQRANRHETLAALALMDRVKTAAGTAVSLQARQLKGKERGAKGSRELVARLALQLHLVEHGIRDLFEGAPVEAIVAVEPAMTGGTPPDPATLEWCGRVLAMYRGWAVRRHMQSSEVMHAGQRRLPYLLLSGFGAYRTLAPEQGLHVYEAGEGLGSGRSAARVHVLAAPLADLPPERLAAHVRQQVAQAATSPVVVRRYRETPSPLVRNTHGVQWRSGRLDAVLAGDFDLIAALHDPDDR